jgi:hypothetical protein
MVQETPTVLCTGRITQAEECPGLFGRPGLVTVLTASIFVIQPIIEPAILETVLPDLRYL